MKPGFWKIVHQPVVLINSSGRNEEMNRPKVGMIQMTAMMSETIVAVRDVSRFLTRAALVPSALKPRWNSFLVSSSRGISTGV